MAFSFAKSFSADTVHFGLGVFDGAALREPDLERERFARLAALGEGFGFVGDGERARRRAGEREGVDLADDAGFADAFFGLAFFGVGLRAAESPRDARGDVGVAAGDLARAAGERVADLRAEGEREDAWEDAAGAFVPASVTFSGVVGLAPTDFSSSARFFGDSAGDFFALVARGGEVRSAAATACVTLSLM